MNAKKLMIYLVSLILLLGTLPARQVSAEQSPTVPYLSGRHANFSSDSIDLSWRVRPAEAVHGIEIVAENKNGKEELLATLGANATEYAITERVSQYRTITVRCYQLEGGEKIYGQPWVIKNQSFVPYQLAEGITGVQFPTQKEIKKQWRKLSPRDVRDKYSQKPKNKAPYRTGAVAPSTLKNGIKTLNFIRYVAGIPADVSIEKSCQEKAQAAALVNYNDKTAWISHSPNKPKGMSNSLYQLGYDGSSSSNLGAGYSNLYQAIVGGWMSDSDGSNIDRVGHRRWCLNPSMKYTGFGIDNDIFTMYSFDMSQENVANIHGVSWPARNTPLSFFKDADPWSISMGVSVPTSGTKVVLTRKKDKKTWTFTPKKSKKSGNYMNINNDGYGMGGCIIFRPGKIHYKKGDSFRVDISGPDFAFSYDVDFFKL